MCEFPGGRDGQAWNWLIHKSVRYNHIKVTRSKAYFTHYINGGGDSMYTADNICKIIEFLIDNISVQFEGRPFHQVIIMINDI